MALHRKKLRGNLVFLSAGVALCVSAPTYAFKMMVEYTGLIDSGQRDAQGYFGPAGGNISDKVFNASFSYDTDLGLDVPSNGGHELRGGQYYGVASPYTSSFIKIAGARLDTIGFYMSRHLAQYTITSDIVTGFNSDDPLRYPYTYYDYFSASIYGLGLPTLLGETAYIASFGSGSFTRYAEAYQGNNRYIQSTAEQFNFTVSYAPISTAPDSSTVPEPSDWLLLLIGFGAIGCAARRHQNIVV